MNGLLHFTALVGTSFSGKSTLLNDLSAMAGDTITAIPEYCDYAGGNKNFRRMPFKNAADAAGNIDDFISWELARQGDAGNLSGGIKPIIMDRTVYCFLLTQLFLRQRFPHAWNSFESGIEKVAEAVGKGEICLPERLLLLEPIDEATFLSRTARGTSVGFFSQVSSWRFFSQAYRDIASLLYRDGSALIMESDNRHGTRSALAKQALRFISARSDMRAISAQNFRMAFNAIGGRLYE